MADNTVTPKGWEWSTENLSKDNSPLHHERPYLRRKDGVIVKETHNTTSKPWTVILNGRTLMTGGMHTTKLIPRRWGTYVSAAQAIDKEFPC